MISLPIHDPVLIFSIVMIMVLSAPLIAEKIRLPGIVGLIFAGIIFGPHLFGILERDDTINLLGTIGLLYIMFQAGLEINLEQIQKNKHHSIVFGLLTFIIPLTIGTWAGYSILKMSLVASILLASMFSSHTLLTFPIISRLGLAKKPAATATIGGTIITDTLAFVILAVVLASTHGQITFLFWLKLFASTAVYTAAVILLLPRLAHWFFTRFSSESGIEEYAFVITALFVSAYFSHVAGLEPIIGAFLAGLTLNALIPEKSVLMNRIQFVGNALFIPFFLISVGMLIDPGVLLRDVSAIRISLVMIAVALLTKWLAAYVFGKSTKMSSAEIGIIFGMSVNQAAATLAAVMVGYRVGLFNESVLTGTIMMIVVTCFVGSLTTQKYAKRTILESKETFEASTHTQPDRILIPLSNPDTVNALMDFALLLHPKSSHEALYPIHVAIEGPQEKTQLLTGETLLTKATTRATAVQKHTIPLSKIDTSVPHAIVHAIKEQRISKIVVGWNEQSSFRYTLFNTVTEQVIAATQETIFITRIVQPVSLATRVVVVIPPFLHKQAGFTDTLRTLKKLSSALTTEFVIAAEQETVNDIAQTPFFKSAKPKCHTVAQWKQLANEMRSWLHPSDFIIIMLARQGQLAWKMQFDRLPFKLKETFETQHNLAVVYPYGYTDSTVEVSNDVFNTELALLATLPENHFMFNTHDDISALFAAIPSHSTTTEPSVITDELMRAALNYPIDLTEEVMLVHIHTPYVEMHEVYIASQKHAFKTTRTSPPKIIFILLSPETQPVQKHLEKLSEISGLVMNPQFTDAAKKATSYQEFVEFLTDNN